MQRSIQRLHGCTIWLQRKRSKINSKQVCESWQPNRWKKSIAIIKNNIQKEGEVEPCLALLRQCGNMELELYRLWISNIFPPLHQNYHFHKQQNLDPLYLESSLPQTLSNLLPIEFSIDVILTNPHQLFTTWVKYRGLKKILPI